MIVWILGRLVWKNYRLRQAGVLPDEWYWADLALFKRGYQVDPDNGGLRKAWE